MTLSSIKWLLVLSLLGLFMFACDVESHDCKATPFQIQYCEARDGFVKCNAWVVHDPNATQCYPDLICEDWECVGKDYKPSDSVAALRACIPDSGIVSP